MDTKSMSKIDSFVTSVKYCGLSLLFRTVYCPAPKAYALLRDCIVNLRGFYPPPCS